MNFGYFQDRTYKLALSPFPVHFDREKNVAKLCLIPVMDCSEKLSSACLLKTNTIQQYISFVNYTYIYIYIYTLI